MRVDVTGEFLSAEQRPYEFTDEKTGEIKKGISTKVRILGGDDETVAISVPAASNLGMPELQKFERLSRVKATVDIKFFGDRASVSLVEINQAETPKAR